MDKLDPFDGDDDGSDQEAPPPAPPQVVPTQANVPETSQAQQPKVVYKYNNSGQSMWLQEGTW